jgi:GNAT superfamily N-acetyltransferase
LQAIQLKGILLSFVGTGMAIEVKPPQEWPRDKFSIFLAGAIDMGAAKAWQSYVVKHLSAYDVVILNPRREDWDSSWKQEASNPQFREQVAWESFGLRDADFRIFTFLNDSEAPITLLELGEHITEPGAVCCEPKYYRKGNVDITGATNGMPVFESLNKLIVHLQTILDEKGLRLNPGKTASQEIVKRKLLTTDSTLSEEAQPQIEYQLGEGGDSVWVYTFEVPDGRHRRGLGSRAWKEFEDSLPSSVREIGLMATDYGDGPSDGFWQKMGFVRAYPQSKDYERRQVMRKRPKPGKTATLKSSQYAPVLRNAGEIATYIATYSSDEVDEEFIEEALRDTHAVLRELPIDSIREGDPDHNIPSKAKERQYSKLNLDTMPPIVVDNGQIEDGNHRYRVAKAAGRTTIWAYVVEDGEVQSDRKSIKSATGNSSKFSTKNRSITAALEDDSITGTSDFKQWFKRSKVVDSEGKPLYVWHGSNARFDEFKPNFENDGFTAFFTEDKALAQSYGGTLYQAYLSIQKPAPDRAVFEAAREAGLDEDFLQDEYPGIVLNADDEVVNLLKAKGYDGWIGMDSASTDAGDMEEAMTYVVFSPEQIRRITSKTAAGQTGLIEIDKDYGEVHGTVGTGREFLEQFFDDYGVRDDEESTRLLNDFADAGIALLKNIDVNDDRRGEGFGNRLLNLFLREAESKGAQVAFLIVDIVGDNEFDLTTWYARHGFVRETETEAGDPVMVLDPIRQVKSRKVAASTTEFKQGRFPTFQEFLESEGGLDALLSQDDWETIADRFDEPAFFNASPEEQKQMVRDRAFEDQYHSYENALAIHESHQWPMPVYREISLDGGIESLRTADTGIYWSWDIAAAEAHWGSGRNNFLLKGLVDQSAIDWRLTILHNMQISTGEDEKEITLRHGAKIKFVGYKKVEDLRRFRKDDGMWTPLPAVKSLKASQKSATEAKCGSCGCTWEEHHHLPDFSCKNEPGCGCVGWTDKKSAGLKIATSFGPLYHGSPFKFKIFRTRRGQREGQQYSLGAYFTDNRKAAERFAWGPNGNVRTVEVELNKPLDLRELGEDYTRIPEALPWLTSAAKHECRTVSCAGIYRKLEELDKKFNLVPRLKRRGYDGIIFDGSDEGTTYVVFYHNQIKDLPEQESATADSPVKVAASNKETSLRTGVPVTCFGFHGTASEFEQFNTSLLGSASETSDAKEGFWFSQNPLRAEMAAWDACQVIEGFDKQRDGERATVLECELRMDNPYVDARSLKTPGDSAQALKRAKERGFDGVIFTNGEMGTNFVVWNPAQIKIVDTVHPSKKVGAHGEQYFAWPHLVWQQPIGKRAASYDDLFRALITACPAIQGKVKQEVAWAKRSLKKSNRVIWWLRWYRIALADWLVYHWNATVPIGDTEVPEDNIKQVRDLATKYWQEGEAKSGSSRLFGDLRPHFDPATDPGWEHFLSFFEHVYSIDYAPIQNFDPGFKTIGAVYSTLNGFDREYAEQAKGTLSPQEEDSIFLDCGGGWAWWLLPRSSCDAEARAMGHCGNSPDSDRTDMSILSLRQGKTVGSKEVWEPHLTFILHRLGDDADSGTLGEMKGKGNAKPVPRYFPYIVKLLRDPRIKGIDGGGYKPENNFSPKDLSPEQLREVKEVNPDALLSLKQYYRENGFDDVVAARVAAKLGIKNEHTYDGFVVNSWESYDAFLKECGDREAEDLNLYLSTGNLGFFADYALENIDEESPLWTALAGQLLVEFGKRVSARHGIKTGVFEALKEIHANEDSKLRQVLEEGFDEARTATLSESEKKWRDDSSLQGLMYTALDNATEGSPTTFEHGRGDRYLQVIPDDYALDLALGNREVSIEKPHVYVSFNFSIDVLEAFIEKHLDPSVARIHALEQEGQGRLFKRPDTDEEAQENGVHVSNLLRKEAASYEEMFKPLLALAPGMKAKVDESIKWAKRVLKKQNRIVWWLRWVRLALIAAALKNPGANADSLKTLESKVQREMSGKADVAHAMTFGYLKTLQPDLSHLYSLDVSDIQEADPGWKYPEAFVLELRGYEKAYIDDASGSLSPQSDDEVFIDFGDGWAWWLLPRASCSDEAEAMGHCGNSPAGHRTDRNILSLRQQKNVAGREKWEPHLTFILHTDGKTAGVGALGEMKGKGNDKPKPKYFPYIIRLLEDHRIKGLIGGGYMPEHNFRFSDLTAEQRKAVREVNPDAYFTFEEYMEKGNIDMEAVASRMGIDPDNDFKLEDGTEVYLINQWNSEADFIENCGMDEAKKVQSCIDGWLGFFSEHLLNKIERFVPVFKSIADQINAEFSNQHVSTEDRVVVKDVIAALEDIYDSGEGDSVLRKGLEKAWFEGKGYGYNNFTEMMREDIKESVVNDDGYEGPVGKLLISGHRIKQYVTAQELLEMAHSGHYDDSEPEWEMPRVYGPNLEELDNPQEALDALADYFKTPVVSPRKLEERGQQRLFRRPETDEEARREGLHISSLNTASKLYYHGTNAEAAEYIREHGFSTEQRFKGIQNGPEGELTFITPSKDTAKWFAENSTYPGPYGGEPKNGGPVVLPVNFSGHVLAIPGSKSIYEAARTLGVNGGRTPLPDLNEFREKLKEAGYDAVAFRDPHANGRAAVAVFDTSKLLLAGSKTASGAPILLKTVDGSLRGFIETQEEFEAEWSVSIPWKRVAYLDYVIVKPESRRKGVATQLIKEFIKTARARGAEACLLHPIAEGGVDNSSLIAMYTKLGFYLMEVPEDEHDDPPTIMVKELSTAAKTAYLSPKAAELTVAFDFGARPRSTIMLDLGIPNFTVFALTFPIDGLTGADLVAYTEDALEAVLDEVAAFMMTLKYSEDQIITLFNLARQCFRSITVKDASDSQMPDHDNAIQMYEGTFEIPAEFVDETHLRVITAAKEQPNSVTETPEFKRWFTGSKVVNSDGSPMVVYHGTWESFDEFDTGKSFDGGFHFGTADAANARLGPDEDNMRGRNIMPVYLSIKNPKRLNDDPYDEDTWCEVIAAAKEEGHDGIVYPNRIEGGESWVAFQPNQIKSAIGNSGAFDPNSNLVTAGKTVKRVPNVRHMELTTLKQDKSNPARVIQLYRNRSLRSLPRPHYVMVYDQRGRGIGVLPLAKNWEQRLLSRM